MGPGSSASSSGARASSSSIAPGVEPAPSIHLAYSETTFFSPVAAAASPPLAGAASATGSASCFSPPTADSRESSLVLSCETSSFKSATVSSRVATLAFSSASPPPCPLAAASCSAWAFLANVTASSSAGRSAASFTNSVLHCARLLSAVAMISAFFVRPSLSFSIRSARSCSSRSPSSLHLLEHWLPGVRDARPASSLPSQQSQMPSSTREE
mmetsp:Transcript_390/g.926  ORF Transcript_390/g.926 Transcript_390/m.926 type:complete len:213 (-) Transcript_390:339-977(-)